MSGFEHADAKAVVIFADMSGYTALTEVHGDHRAAELADQFGSIATEVLGPGDALIKTIGDAVMVTAPDAHAALAYLTRLGEAARRTPGFPLVRAGLSEGPVIWRRGDIFGATVNTAARLAGLAHGGQVATTRDVASRACVPADLVRDIGSTTIRNVRAPVDVVIIDSGSSHQDHVDPVCRVHLSADARHSAATHEDRLYWFCSPLCAEQFVRRPQTYVPEGAAVSALRDNAESPCC